MDQQGCSQDRSALERWEGGRPGEHGGRRPRGQSWCLGVGEVDQTAPFSDEGVGTQDSGLETEAGCGHPPGRLGTSVAMRHGQTEEVGLGACADLKCGLPSSCPLPSTQSASVLMASLSPV